MNPVPPGLAENTERLGQLAMRFRSTRNNVERRKIADAYSETVQHLIKSGHWHEMPPFEDQLPDDWMPREFFDYWS